MYQKLLTYFSLFGSVGTLLCCALPVLLVSLGMGAVFASLTSAVPQIVWIAEHKAIIFISTGLMLALSVALNLYSSQKSCPVDAKKAEVCASTKKMTKPILIISIIVYAVGVLFSYVLPWVIYG